MRQVKKELYPCHKLNVFLNHLYLEKEKLSYHMHTFSMLSHMPRVKGEKSRKMLPKTKWQVWFTKVLFTNFIM